MCRCDHVRQSHVRRLGGCAMFECRCEGFMEPALPPCGEDVCTRNPEDCRNGCQAAADELAQQTQDMEHCAHVGARETDGRPSPDSYSDYRCDTCGASWRRYWDRKGQPSEPLTDPYEGEQGNCATGMSEEDIRGLQEAVRQGQEALRRPPYAVQYTAGGRAYELLLPGDCSVHTREGVLVVQHAEAVDGLTHVVPVGRAS